MNALLDTLGNLVKPGMELVLSSRKIETPTPEQTAAIDSSKDKDKEKPKGAEKFSGPTKYYAYSGAGGTAEGAIQKLARSDSSKANQAKRFERDGKQWLLGQPTQLLPGTGTFFHPIFGLKEFNPATHQRYVDMFNANPMGKLYAININHKHDLGAIGAIYSLEAREDEGLWYTPMWLERGERIMGDDAFWYSSAEIAGHWMQPRSKELFEDFITGVAVTNDPFFTGEITGSLASLTTMSTSLESYGLTAGRSIPEQVKEVFVSVAPRAQDAPEDEPAPTPAKASESEPEPEPTPEDKEGNMSDNPKGDVGTVQLTADQHQELMDSMGAFKAYKEETKREISALNKANELMSATAERTTLWTSVARWSGDREKNTELMLALTKALKPDVFKQVFALVDDLNKQFSASAAMGEVGTTRTPEVSTNYSSLTDKAEAILKENPNMSKFEALKLAGQQESESYNSYQDGRIAAMKSQSALDNDLSMDEE